MPPRWLCILIILCWLSLNGWLFWQELLPQVLPGQPPPFSIDLVEEAQTERIPTTWTVEHNGREAFLAKTRIEHPHRDVFELVADYRPVKAADVSAYGIRLSKMFSTYRVNSGGDLLGLEVHYEGTPEFPLPFLQGQFEITIAGEVESGRLKPTLSVTAGGHKKQGVPMTELEVGRGGAVLLPLHPVKRLRGLKPGQTWRTVILDPIPDSIVAVQGLTGEARVVTARVRSWVELFSWGRRTDVPCLVIDYEGDRVKVSTWVSHDDGAVLCQEAKLGSVQWSLYRH
jgi:hypothetical protein